MVLRRQNRAGGSPAAGSGRALRLDPHSLPIRYTTVDTRADNRSRTVEIDRNRVMLFRSVNGVRMRLRIPLDGFLGVAVRIAITGEDESSAAVTLEHPDPALSVALYVAGEIDEAAAEWQSWARALGCPLLIADADGTLRPPVAMAGPLMAGETAMRRRRRSALRKRRPYFMARRKGFAVRLEPVVHRGEREIIAPE
jgi:hypothetical protein